MLYGEECVSSLIKCQMCQCKLTEAKILLCGLFCNNCTVQLCKNVDKGSNEFTCKSCDETHSIPKNGFKRWKALNEFYSKELKLEEIYRGESAEKLKQNLNEIREHINYLEFNLKNGTDKVKEHCLRLRNEVSLEAEITIERIQDIRDVLIEEINDYQAICLSQIESDKIQKQQFQKFIDELKDFDKVWSEYLKKYQIHDSEMVKANGLSLELETMVNKVKINLDNFFFNNKSMSYRKNQNKIEKDFLGNLDLWF